MRRSIWHLGKKHKSRASYRNRSLKGSKPEKTRTANGPSLSDSLSGSASVDRSEPGNPQVGPDHYLNPACNIPARWSSFGHQVSEILSPGATSCLEVGIGSGAVSQFL